MAVGKVFPHPYRQLPLKVASRRILEISLLLIDAVAEKELLNDFDKMSEFVFLGLRLKEGISEKEFENRFKLNIDEVFGEQIEKYRKMGFLIREKGIIRFSDKGFFVSNTILSDFV